MKTAYELALALALALALPLTLSHSIIDTVLCHRFSHQRFALMPLYDNRSPRQICRLQ